MVLLNTKKLLCSKRNGHLIEEAVHRMRKKKSLPVIHLTGINNQNMQGTQNTKLSNNQRSSEEMGKLIE
jgi:hypothetical protein